MLLVVTAILAPCGSLRADMPPSAPDLVDTGQQLRQIIGGKIEANAISSIPGAVVKNDFDGLSMSPDNTNAETVGKRLRVKAVLKACLKAPE
mgnify:CR=1 FL=1